MAGSARMTVYVALIGVTLFLVYSSASDEPFTRVSQGDFAQNAVGGCLLTTGWIHWVCSTTTAVARRRASLLWLPWIAGGVGGAALGAAVFLDYLSDLTSMACNPTFSH